MARRIVIIGAGYTGTRLAQAAHALGDEVAVARRSATALEGIESLSYDISTAPPQALDAWLDASTTMVYSVPTLQGDDHLAPMRRLLDHAASRGIARVVYLSSTSVYGDHQGAWVDETSTCRPSSPFGHKRIESEQLVASYHDRIAHCHTGRIVGIYGPGRTLVDYIQRGRYRVVDGGRKITNRVHVDDIVGALLAIIAQAPSGAEIYNISDGAPKTVRELIDFLVDDLALIAPPPEETLEELAARRGDPNVVARWTNTMRVSNARLTDELGYRLRYPDVFAGYRAIYDA